MIRARSLAPVSQLKHPDTGRPFSFCIVVATKFVAHVPHTFHKERLKKRGEIFYVFSNEKNKQINKYI
jgi:hypothetical protein